MTTYHHGLKVQGIGELALCDVGTCPLRIRKGGVTYGLELVAVDDPNASVIRIKTSAGIKAIRKYPTVAVKLLGTFTDGNAGLAANYIISCKFQAALSGIMSSFRLYSRASGNVKVAIYTGGEALITAMNIGQPAIAYQWNALTFNNTPIVQGQYYWLCAIADTGSVISQVPNAGIARYKYASYSGFTFPDPLGSGVLVNYERAFAGWGLT